MLRRYSIGRLKERELDRVLEIEAASFGKDAYDRKLFAKYLLNCGDLFLGAWKGGKKGKGRKLCGYMLTSSGAPGRRAELVSVAVDPAYRGQGVGTALMKSTLRRLRWRGIDRLGLMVKLTNLGARRFYEKYGFTKRRLVKGYYEDGSDGVLMVKEILAVSE